ncbi:MAG: hypothetical protein OEY09_17510 [Gammaproteobacteria bacterium]|nr:hypothetical protein [Gammaproteobacteria bacterium]
MQLLDISNALKFKWRNTYASLSQDDALLSHRFEIEPDEFLKFAAKDYLSGDLQGLVNSVTNAKRAIDCQVDSIISCFGYDPYDSLPDVAQQYINEYQNKSGAFEATNKLKLLQSLDIAPSALVTSMREVRNKLEHHYKKPSEQDALHIIDLAKLFIRSSDFVLRLFPQKWFLLDSEYVGKSTKIIAIEYQDEKNKFILKLTEMIQDKESEDKNKVIPNCIGEIEVLPTDEHYPYLLALNVCYTVDGYIEEPLSSFVTSVDNRIRKSQVSFKSYTDEPSLS